jgi:hypothetical protein
LLKGLPSYDAPKYYLPDNHYVRALYRFSAGKAQPFAGFADDQQYLYYAAIVKHAGSLPRPLAFKLIYDAYTEPMLYRYYCDDSPAPPGMNRFDLHPFNALDGQLTDYRSDRKGPHQQPRPAGSRMGPQNMVVCGWALQALEEYGDIWEERHTPGAENDQAVLIEQFPPNVPKPDRAAPFFEFRIGTATLGLSSTLRGLQVQGEFSDNTQLIRIFSRPDGQATYAAVMLGKELVVTNGLGEKLLVEKVESSKAGKGLRFAFFLPYTVVKGQKQWANGIPHGRYSIQVGEASQNLYFTQEEEQVKRWLFYELAGGLRTWEAVFREKGYIPTGLGEPRWERFSDTGGYAHLISAAAQYIFYLDGKKDWLRN